MSEKVKSITFLTMSDHIEDILYILGHNMCGNMFFSQVNVALRCVVF